MCGRIRRVALFIVAFLALWVSHPAPAAVGDGYKTPLLTIPYTSQPPVIDSVIRDEQWQGALSVNALQTTEAAVSTRQARVWYLWDEDHLYIAMRSPLRPGERVLQANRQQGRDDSQVVFDDSYEIWLNANTYSPDGEQVFFQYLGNAAGAKYDVMFEPLVGNSRPGWESHWKPMNRITPDGKFWEMEVAIPRQSIYHDAPFADGEEIGGLFVRNFKRPWEQNSLGGSGSFSAPDSHCRFILSKSAPAIHLLGVADPSAKTFGVALSAFADRAQRLHWTFASDGGVNRSGELDIAGGHEASATPCLALDRPGDGRFRIRVTSEDNSRTFLDWSSRRAFGDFSATTQPIDDTPDQATLKLTFNPVRNYVRVEGDFINYENRAAIRRFAAEVLDSQGRPLASQELKLDALAYVHGLLQLGDVPPGSYTARLACFDADGKRILQKDTPFTKKDPARDFAWWNTKCGDIDRVVSPWTPMLHEGNAIAVWGRELQVGTAGLPAQISTQGRKILAGPMRLIGEGADGELDITDGTEKTLLDSDHRIIVSSGGRLGGIDVQNHVTAEFDGMYKIDLTLTPRQSTALRSLKLVVPIRPEFAKYFHACGEGIRYGFSYGYLPAEKTGRVWGSNQVDGQPMLVGSFIPYVFVGSDFGGLCWFADSDEGWEPNDNTPAIEIRRDATDHVDLVLNLVSSDVVLNHPRKITFAFEATPVKPLQPGWRMETWSTGDSFQDFCQVQPRGGDLIWDALPFTLDPEACRKMVQAQHAKTTGYLFGIDKYHLNAVPYFENNSIDEKFVPEGSYFLDEWHARVSSSLCYCKTLSDFIVYHLDQWIKQTGIDGWYVDNVRPVACDNIDAGRGYRLPDGRIQPSYQMFATREFFLRVRAVFAENGKSGKFVLHMTHHMIMPWVGACDVALDGEDHVTFQEMGKDFMDFWSPERMRLDYPEMSGVPVTFLKEYQGRWDPPRLHKVMRAYTGMCLLNDVLPGANPDGNNQETWEGRDRFAIQDSDVRFIPYWLKNSGIACTGQNMSASAWLKPESLLLAVVNRGEAATANIKIDFSAVGFGTVERCKAVDAETGQTIDLSTNGTMSVEVPRHDYRQIIISAAGAR
jgi:hypothetical protein